MLQLAVHTGINDETLTMWMDSLLDCATDDRIFNLRQVGIKRAMRWIIKS